VDNLFDQIAKKIGKEALDASGLTVIQHEISRGAQHADLYHEPDPGRRAERARLGLLGRMAAYLCLIEVYGHAPRGMELRALLVRLMAGGPLFSDALADLAALPEDAHERTVAEAPLAELQQRLGKKRRRTREEEEFVMSMQGTWKEARKQGRDEGRAEEGARAVLAVLRVRGIAVPDAANERILAEKDPARLERWLERAVLAVSVADVLDEPS
jgi:hypothetical protein